MSRTLFVLGIPGIAVLSACTAIVAGQLSPYDDYAKDGGGSSNPQSADTCALTDPDGGNLCSECISTNCADEVEYACNRTGNQKPWFRNISDCAQNPYEDYTPLNSGASFWECKSYRDLDGGTLTGDDPVAHERNSQVCIRDNCVSGPTPACAICNVVHVEGSASTRFPLENTSCGKCLVQKCAAELVTCCQTQLVEDNLEFCADLRDAVSIQKCQQVGLVEAGAIIPDSGPVSVEEQCDHILPTCYKKCMGSGDDCP